MRAAALDSVGDSLTAEEAAGIVAELDRRIADGEDPDRQPISPAEPAGTLAIEIRPYAPGLLLMTLPVGLILPESHARKLLARIHDGLDELRRLKAEQSAAPKHQKKQPAARKRVGARKRTG
jgi:hypothetical protein